MDIILPTDTFPPGNVGGSAWSSETLARALLARGHVLTAIVPQRTQKASGFAPHFRHNRTKNTRSRAASSAASSADPSNSNTVPVQYVHYWAPNLPFVQNYFRHERLWPLLTRKLIALGKDRRPLLIHAQHVQTAPPAVEAARILGVPSVVTVRDHWPYDYFATGLHGNRFPYAYPYHAAETRLWAGVATDLLGRLGPRGVLACPAIPYIIAHTRRRAAMLAQADAVIAVSRYMAERLVTIVSPSRLHVIPNMVDIAANDAIARQLPSPPLADRLPPAFLLFIGKLEQNKGAGLLVEVFQAIRQRTDMPLPPLLVVGNGPLQQPIAQTLGQLGAEVEMLSWVAHDDVLRLMARCEMLLFPSLWGEPLSRVLLEASALGAPIIAMRTGGTSDLIVDGETGMLVSSAAAMADQLIALLRTPEKRRALGEQARIQAIQRFGVEAVLPRVEALYDSLQHHKGK